MHNEYDGMVVNYDEGYTEIKKRSILSRGIFLLVELIFKSRKGSPIEIPPLPTEIIQRIAIFLQLPDVCSCMLVCKDWKECLSSQQFCKRFLFKHYNFDLEKEATGHLKEWKDDWFCYWTEDDDAYVFSDPPKRWKCGIVHLAEYCIESDTELKYKDFLQAVYILMRIQNAAAELQLDCGAWANEGTGVIEVCLFPWNKSTLPTAQDILTLFHFHPEMHKDPMVDVKATDMEIGDKEISEEENVRKGHVKWNTLSAFDVDVEKAVKFFEWLQKIFSRFVRIGVGCNQMNPVPCFILAKLAPGWVGGILTSLALT